MSPRTMWCRLIILGLSVVVIKSPPTMCTGFIVLILSIAVLMKGSVPSMVTT